MTPLEKAMAQREIKLCIYCADMRIVNSVSYCGKSGKILHPYLLRPDNTAGCPHQQKEANAI